MHAHCILNLKMKLNCGNLETNSLLSCSFPLLLMLTLSFPHLFGFFFVLFQSTFLLRYLHANGQTQKSRKYNA